MTRADFSLDIDLHSRCVECGATVEFPEGGERILESHDEGKGRSAYIVRARQSCGRCGGERVRVSFSLDSANEG